jgi:hypothetical protein
MERKMFSGNRYMTKGIQTFLRPDLQILLWDLIDGLDVEKDYLQVFRLEMKEEDLKLTHQQENPDYSVSYTVKVDHPSIHQEEKIYVIDDGDYATMMFASEY